MKKQLELTRQSVTRKFKIQNWKGYLTIGFYDNDQPGEVFIKVSKQGTSVSGLCDIIAVQASMMLQQGFTWKQIADKWLHTRFEPHGVGYDGEEFTSLMDCIAKAGSEVISVRGGREDKDCHDSPKEASIWVARACTPYERGKLACAAHETTEPPIDLVTAEAKLQWLKGYLEAAKNEDHGYDPIDGDGKATEGS